VFAAITGDPLVRGADLEMKKQVGIVFQWDNGGKRPVSLWQAIVKGLGVASSQQLRHLVRAAVAHGNDLQWLLAPALQWSFARTGLFAEGKKQGLGSRTGGGGGEAQLAAVVGMPPMGVGHIPPHLLTIEDDRLTDEDPSPNRVFLRAP